MGGVGPNSGKGNLSIAPDKSLGRDNTVNKTASTTLSEVTGASPGAPGEPFKPALHLLSFECFTCGSVQRGTLRMVFQDG